MIVQWQIKAEVLTDSQWFCYVQWETDQFLQQTSKLCVTTCLKA